MTRPERIAALREHLAEVGREVASFRAALALTNAPEHQDFFGGLLDRIGQIIANEQSGVTIELAGDLLKARQDLRRIVLPEKDPDYEAPTAALRALRGERGNLVEALENALESAQELGMAPRLSEFGELKVPRDAIAVQLARLDERLRATQDAVDSLRQTAAAADTAGAQSKAGVSQRGIVNLHVAALTVEVSAARFETKIGDNPAVPAETDLAALARTAEAIRDLGRDLKATVEGLGEWMSPAVAVAGRLVARFGERSANGVRTVIRFVRRRLMRRGENQELFDSSALPPPDFDIVEVKRRILAGEALPAAWIPLIEDLNLTWTPLHDLAPLAGLANLRTLSLESTKVADLAPLAGLVNLHTLDFGGTRVADLAPLAGLANLHTLDFGGTRVADLAPIAGLANLHTLDLNATQVADLAPLARLANLHLLRLNGTQVSDLAPLAGLANLETLDLRGTWELSDLAPIAGLARLQSLLISSTRVADLAPIAGLANLQTLFLSSTQVSDLAPLAKLANLQTLWLDGTRVSDLAPLAGLAKLTVRIGDRRIQPFELARQGRSLRVADILK